VKEVALCIAVAVAVPAHTRDGRYVVVIRTRSFITFPGSAGASGTAEVARLSAEVAAGRLRHGHSFRRRTAQLIVLQARANAQHWLPEAVSSQLVVWCLSHATDDFIRYTSRRHLPEQGSVWPRSGGERFVAGVCSRGTQPTTTPLHCAAKETIETVVQALPLHSTPTTTSARPRYKVVWHLSHIKQASQRYCSEGEARRMCSTSRTQMQRKCSARHQALAA
jgi:hypothetical protein